MSEKIILVVGATGAQGGSVARYLLGEPEFIVYCLVRNPNSERAQELSQLGAHLVVGDLEDKESLVKAMEGVYGVFGVTNFWDPAAGFEGEIRQGKNLAWACKEAQIKHLVYSTLDRNSDVPHFESKVIVEDYIKELGVPCTFLVTSFYFENFFTFFPPQKKSENKDEFVFSVPQKSTTRVPMYSVADTGGFVLEIFKEKDPNKYIGHDVSAVSEYITYPELVHVFSYVTGKPATFIEVPLEEFRKHSFPGVEELAANFHFFDQLSEGHKVDRRISLVESQKVWSEACDWQDFVTQHKVRW